MQTIQDLIANAMFAYSAYDRALSNVVNADSSDQEEWDRLQELKERTEAEALETLKALEDLGINVPILKFLR